MNLLRLLLWGPLHIIFSHLPLSLRLQFCRATGAILFFWMSERSRFIQDEYAQIFPEKNNEELKALVAETYAFSVNSEIENSHYNNLSPDNIRNFIEVEGLDRLDKSLARERGVILVTFHFGAHMHVMPALGCRGYLLNQVVNRWVPDENKRKSTRLSRALAKYLHKLRLMQSGAKIPANVIPISAGRSLRPLFKALNDKEVLVIAMDGRRSANLQSFPFFHYPSYWFATGAIDLAMRTGAALHPIFALRDKEGKNRLIIEEEIVLEKIDGGQESTFYTQKLILLLQEYIKKYPCHYGMELFFEKMRLEILNQNGPAGISSI